MIIGSIITFTIWAVWVFWALLTLKWHEKLNYPMIALMFFISQGVSLSVSYIVGLFL